VITQYLKEKLSQELTEELGRINEYMGSIRPIVKAAVATEAQRRQVYRRILRELLDTERTALSEERLRELMTSINISRKD
jgi:siroheme synthase (precorrin-2 oxidase/ferrochelatase)